MSNETKEKLKYNLIGFLATSKSGKDTCADYLVEKYNYTKLAFAEPIKKASSILFGFTEEQLYGNLKEKIDKNWDITPRQALQYLGTDVFRKDVNKLLVNIKDDFWVNCLKVDYNARLRKNNDFMCVISDVRFQNEVDLIVSLGGIVIKLERPCLNENLDKSSLHESEMNIANVKNFKYLIVNDSTLDNLYKKVEDIVK